MGEWASGRVGEWVSGRCFCIFDNFFIYFMLFCVQYRLKTHPLTNLPCVRNPTHPLTLVLSIPLTLSLAQTGIRTINSVDPKHIFTVSATTETKMTQICKHRIFPLTHSPTHPLQKKIRQHTWAQELPPNTSRVADIVSCKSRGNSHWKAMLILPVCGWK